jgi:hypothetical protein
VSQATDPKRWIAGDADVPAELTRLLRAGRDEIGTADELAELARRLSVELGPASGLSVRAPLDATAPAGAVGGARGLAGHGAGALGRIGAWVVAGGGAVTVAWLVASALTGGPVPPPISAPEDGTRPNELAAIPSAPTVPLVPAADRAAPDVASPAVDPPLDSSPAALQKPTRALRESRGSRASRPAAALEEAALLERAQAALARDPAAALALTREHQRRFARGALGQEREVIAIEALKRLGRHEAASSRAAAFERRYRSSVHRPRLERTKDTSSPTERGLDTDPRGARDRPGRP